MMVKTNDMQHQAKQIFLMFFKETNLAQICHLIKIVGFFDYFIVFNNEYRTALQ